MSVDEYEDLVRSGAIKERNRVHLINGYLVEKMTHKPPHAIADELCGHALRTILTPGWSERAGKPIRIPGLASEPEPDRSIVRGAIRDYAGAHPGPGDVALVVEVAKTTLSEDRRMAEIYGKAGIPAYWIINVADRQVEVYSRPSASGYQSIEVLAPGHVLTLDLDGVTVGEIAVEALLP
jgi:Uma2 family endonuclease